MYYAAVVASLFLSLIISNSIVIALFPLIYNNSKQKCRVSDIQNSLLYTMIYLTFSVT